MNVMEALGWTSAMLLRRFDPETAHKLAVLALRTGLVPPMPVPRDPRLAVQLMGLDFAHPVGLAAGFDKNAEIADALLGQGFSHIEVGTITPRPQPGNPRPRVFRLTDQKAVINRFGFNGKGHAHALDRLRRRAARGGIVGINVGANKDSADRPQDYVEGIRLFAEVASYFTANVSSPNTPGLRDLQARAALDDLIARCIEARDKAAVTAGRRVPLLVKIAPDISEESLDDIATISTSRGVDGLIVTNTTLSRTGITGPMAQESGGLSGQPLFQRSTIILGKMRERVGADMALIGVGGVGDGRQAFDKIAAGADIVQIYTSFIFEGSAVVAVILRELLALLDADGLGSLKALRGRDTALWASRPIPL